MLAGYATRELDVVTAAIEAFPPSVGAARFEPPEMMATGKGLPLEGAAPFKPEILTSLPALAPPQAEGASVGSPVPVVIESAAVPEEVMPAT